MKKLIIKTTDNEALEVENISKNEDGQIVYSLADMSEAFKADCTPCDENGETDSENVMTPEELKLLENNVLEQGIVYWKALEMGDSKHVVLTHLETKCTHCGKTLPKGSKAVWGLNEESEAQILHIECFNTL